MPTSDFTQPRVHSFAELCKVAQTHQIMNMPKRTHWGLSMSIGSASSLSSSSGSTENGRGRDSMGDEGSDGTAEGRSGTSACSAGVCDDLTSGALLCHYRLSRQSCYMFLLLPFLPHWQIWLLVAYFFIRFIPSDPSLFPLSPPLPYFLSSPACRKPLYSIALANRLSLWENGVFAAMVSQFFLPSYCSL